jgi:deoxyribodipyrimidine photolyase-related protein
MRLLVLLGNQLFAPDLLRKKLGESKEVIVYMREDFELCTHFKYHKHKIQFFLSAMRDFAQELRAAGFEVHYEALTRENQSYEQALTQFIRNNPPDRLTWFEIEDKFFERRMNDLATQLKVPVEVWTSPMFLTSRLQFRQYLKEVKKPFMKTFYERQRRRLGILVDEMMNPQGGQWSFDEENRKALPKGHLPPEVPTNVLSEHQQQVARLVDESFPDHPGESHNFWLPTTRAEAHSWLDDFLVHRFRDFGPYEDALSATSPFVYHSVLTPFLNVGLLTPAEVIQKALRALKSHNIPMNSGEGFVRQIIGWREFVRGIYQNHSETQDTMNFWNHRRRLSSHWYSGTTGIEPLDHVIQKVLRYGYAHHIERLMVVGCLMLLMEVDPRDAHKWFMEMFIDSSDWVMGPNVYGMALFSDGGIFATKPYICGSNYYKKMGGYKSGPWQDAVDGLYWSFIDKHKSFFLKNPRLSMMVRSLEKMPEDKKARLWKAAHQWRDRLTHEPKP